MDLIGGEASAVLKIFFVFVFVLALIGVAAWLVRHFGGNKLGVSASRGRMPRLALIDTTVVDGRRRLVLVRRDNVEHLIMIGGPTDILIEPNIMRAPASRDQVPTRSALDTGPRVAPLPDAPWSEAESTPQEWSQSISASPLRCRNHHPGRYGPSQIRLDTQCPSAEPNCSPRLRRHPRARSLSFGQNRQRAQRQQAVQYTACAPNHLRFAPHCVLNPQCRACSRRSKLGPAAQPGSTKTTEDQNLAEMAERLEAALRRSGAAAKPRRRR